MFWPPPCEASWLRLNCKGKQMQPPSPSWMEVEDDPGNLWEPQWKSLSCWKCTMSVKCVVSSEQGSNQNHTTVSMIQFSSLCVSVYSIQTSFFGAWDLTSWVKVFMAPGSDWAARRKPYFSFGFLLSCAFEAKKHNNTSTQQRRERQHNAENRFALSQNVNMISGVRRKRQ